MSKQKRKEIYRRGYVEGMKIMALGSTVIIAYTAMFIKFLIG